MAPVEALQGRCEASGGEAWAGCGRMHLWLRIHMASGESSILSAHFRKITSPAATVSAVFAAWNSCVATFVAFRFIAFGAAMFVRRVMGPQRTHWLPVLAPERQLGLKMSEP